jgi:hypothetical protein
MQKPSLLVYLAHQTLSEISKKGLFRGQYVVFGEYLAQTELLFEISSALGHLYRDNLNTLAITFMIESKTDNVTNLMTESAIERYKQYKPEYKNWIDFFFKTEALYITKKYQKFKLIPNGLWFNPKVYKSKVPYKVAITMLPTYSAEGIALGYQFPELIEKFFSFEYDASEWKKKYSYGLDIGSEPPKTISLKTMQEEVKNFIKPFVEKHYPELLSSLNLK